ncbi:hypothetical protein N7524_001273 [Penicillium chrysogenum]|nr:hypothetical protein N7524_001273 [Penicillium chrysogenum]
MTACEKLTSLDSATIAKCWANLGRPQEKLMMSTSKKQGQLRGNPQYASVRRSAKGSRQTSP